MVSHRRADSARGTPVRSSAHLEGRLIRAFQAATSRFRDSRAGGATALRAGGEPGGTGGILHRGGPGPDATDRKLYDAVLVAQGKSPGRREHGGTRRRTGTYRNR